MSLERTPDASIHGREPVFFASPYAKAWRCQADRRFRYGLLPLLQFPLLGEGRFGVACATIVTVVATLKDR